MKKKTIMRMKYSLYLISFFTPLFLQAIPDYASIAIDPARVQLLGITTEKVITRQLTKKIRTVGIVEVDETKIVHIQTKVTGWIEFLYADFVGIPVSHNQPLFSVYSPELVATQEEHLLALHDLEHPLEGVFANEFKKASQTLLASTKKRLELWDISAEQIAELEKNQIVSKTLVIRSPINGIILKKNAFEGMNVGPGIQTFSIADLSYVWVLADIYEDSIPFINIDHQATLMLTSLPHKEFKGKVTFIDYTINNQTRTVKVRFEFENNDFLIKPGMYGTVYIEIPMKPILSISEEAIIDTGKRKIVFVAKDKGHFEPREVKLGFKAEQFFQVLDGIKEGESVVTSAQFLLDSESRLKALEKRNHHTM